MHSLNQISPGFIELLVLSNETVLHRKEHIFVMIDRHLKQNLFKTKNKVAGSTWTGLNNVSTTELMVNE